MDMEFDAQEESKQEVQEEPMIRGFTEVGEACTPFIRLDSARSDSSSSKQEEDTKERI